MLLIMTNGEDGVVSLNMIIKLKEIVNKDDDRFLGFLRKVVIIVIKTKGMMVIMKKSCPVV